MTSYIFQGQTQQKGTAHANKVVALKVDETNPTTPFTILAEATANGDGTFQLTWEDWDGRVIIGAIDEDETEKLDAVFRDFIVGSLFAGINITQAPVNVIMQDTATGVHITQAPINVILKDTATGVHITQAPVIAVVTLPFNLNNAPPETPLFDLNVEVE